MGLHPRGSPRYPDHPQVPGKAGGLCEKRQFLPYGGNDAPLLPPPGGKTATPGEEAKSEHASRPQITSYEQLLDEGYRKSCKPVGKEKITTKKINGIPATHYTIIFDPSNKSTEAPFLQIRTTVFHTTDGDFALQFICLADPYTKRHTSGIESSIPSFRRLPKKAAADPSALGQLSDNEKYIQAQIDKLSSGWYYFWSRHRNYIILSNAERDFANKIARQLESIRSVFVERFPGEPRVKWIPMVRVCKTANEYYGYGGPKGSAGYWWDRTKEFVFYKDVAAGEKRSFETLRHEAFHQFIHFYLGCAPSTWFDEGHADLFGGAQPVGKRLKITPRQGRRNRIQRAVVNKEFARLKVFLYFSKNVYYSNASLYYAQGWAFVYFLHQGRSEGARVKKEWRSIPERYLENLKQAFAELEKKHPDKVAPKNEVNSALSAEAARIAMDRTFDGWTDKNWDELEKAWIELVK